MTLNRRPKAHATLAATLVALILTACSQQASLEGSADPTVEATPSPSATPEPTLAPAEAFVAYLTDGRFTATADLSGTLVANEESADVTGEWMVSGGDFHLALDVGARPTAEQAVVDGLNYVRQPPRPWTRDLQASIPSDRDFATVLAELRWQPSGEGELVASGAGIDEALTLLGLVDQSVEVDDATLTVRVDRRGVPTEFRVEADVHRLEGDPLLIGWDLVYSLHDVGDLTTVKKPEVWVTYESAKGYSMHHPETWSVTSEPAGAEYPAYDLYLSPIAGEVHVLVFEGLDPAMPANSWLQDAAAVFTDQVAPPEELEPLTVAGAPAIFLATHVSDDTGKWWFMQVSIVGTGRAWDVYSWATPGTEAEARETLDQFLATFEMAES